MKPKAFTQSLKAGAPKSGYLFVGNELFFRDRCRRALKTAMFGNDAQAAEEGIVEIDLKIDYAPAGRDAESKSFCDESTADRIER